MLSTLAFGVILQGPAVIPGLLRVEAMVNPLGIATATPRFSWEPTAAAKGVHNLRQSAYRIRVGTAAGRADLWDSGKVTANESVNIRYAGKPLASNQFAFWQVQLFDGSGRASAWSKPAPFSTGLLNASDWAGTWIGYDKPYPKSELEELFNGAKWIWMGNAETVVFQQSLQLTGGPHSGTVAITCDNRFELSINGEPVATSDDQPDAWRRPVQVKIDRYLAEGTNIIRVDARNEGGPAGLILKMTAVDQRGRHTLVTDQRWQGGPSVDRLAPVNELGDYGMAPWGRLRPATLELPPPRMLRREFQVTKPIVRATLHATALGLLDIRMNGREITDELFMPGWTDYTKRVYSRAYDVTPHIVRGSNAIGITLGDGWYSGYVGFGAERNHYGRKTRARAQLIVEHPDGFQTVVVTDQNWRASTGPTLEGDFLMGEAYDARREVRGWDRPNLRTTAWSPVDTGAEVNPSIEPFPGQPVVPFATLRAKSITEPKPGVYVLDLGQNMAGFARLKLKDQRPGTKIQLRFAERTNPDGTVYTTNLRAARSIDTYICRGGEEQWSPKFTFHGFQYIEVTGLDRAPSVDEVVGIAVSSDCPTVGTFETSDAMLNKLVSNAWWTQRMNFIDIPTDCPQRDERLGWTGDAQAYIKTATMLADVQPFFEKWLVTLDDGQRADGQYPTVAPVKVSSDDGGPAWADAGVICPWTMYETYGDAQTLAGHYPQMKKFIEFHVKRGTPDLLPPKSFHCFGDWLAMDSGTPHEVIYSAYFAGSTRLVAKAAESLNKPDEAAHYRALYERLRAVFQKTYVSTDGTIRGNSQCVYILAIVFDLLDERGAKIAAEKLAADIEKRGHLSTGFVGTRDIMHALSKIGRNDLAFKLLHNKTFPSWGFPIVNGATSIWERWDGWTPEKGFQDPGMNSFSHYAFGAVVGWMFEQPAGIQSFEPGFRRIRIAPQIDPNLRFLKASYRSVRGLIRSEWVREGSSLKLTVEVPVNVRAQVVTPFGPSADVKVTGPIGNRLAGGQWACEVGSGTYTFTAKL